MTDDSASVHGVPWACRVPGRPSLKAILDPVFLDGSSVHETESSSNSTVVAFSLFQRQRPPALKTAIPLYFSVPISVPVPKVGVTSPTALTSAVKKRVFGKDEEEVFSAYQKRMCSRLEVEAPEAAAPEVQAPAPLLAPLPAPAREVAAPLASRGQTSRGQKTVSHDWWSSYLCPSSHQPVRLAVCNEVGTVYDKRALVALSRVWNGVQEPCDFITGEKLVHWPLVQFVEVPEDLSARLWTEVANGGGHYDELWAQVFRKRCRQELIAPAVALALLGSSLKRTADPAMTKQRIFDGLGLVGEAAGAGDKGQVELRLAEVVKLVMVEDLAVSVEDMRLWLQTPAGRLTKETVEKSLGHTNLLSGFCSQPWVPLGAQAQMQAQVPVSAGASVQTILLVSGAQLSTKLECAVRSRKLLCAATGVVSCILPREKIVLGPWW